MFRLRYLILGILLVGLVADFSDARGRRNRGRRSRAFNTGYSNTNYGGGSIYSSPQQAAEAKVAILAARGYGFHPSGGYGGGSREGWGMGPTASAAMWGTCYGGSCMSARGRAQAWSELAQCYFAINIW